MKSLQLENEKLVKISNYEALVYFIIKILVILLYHIEQLLSRLISHFVNKVLGRLSDFVQNAVYSIYMIYHVRYKETTNRPQYERFSAFVKRQYCAVNAVHRF